MIEFSDNKYAHFVNKNRTFMKNQLYSLAFFNSKSVVCDIGAHVGQSALFYAKHAAKVISFEPNPEIFSILERNVRNGGFMEKIVLHNVAIGACDGTIDFALSKTDSATSHIALSRKNNVSVKIQPLDAFNFVDVDFVKVDVEGFEPHVLLGAKRFFVLNRAVWQVEVLDSLLKRYGFNHKDIVDFFLKNLYTPIVYKTKDFGVIADERYYYNRYQILSMMKRGVLGVENLIGRNSDMFFIPNEKVLSYRNSGVIRDE